MTQFSIPGPAAPSTMRWATFARWQARWQTRWSEASAQTRVAIQVAVVVGLAVVAFNFSLQSLLQTLNLETPLAYVSLVPLIALGLAWVRGQPSKSEPAIHDRQVDYIVGVPLLAAAIAIDTLLPAHLSAMFWVWRIDMLTLPLFVAGAVSIIFGVRAMWRQKLAVGYLLLAWPLPYTAVMLGLLNSFTSLTTASLHGLLRVLPVATSLPSGEGSVFSVTHNGHSFPVSIVSACSGVNSVVGFLLVGSAFAAIVRGPLLKKTLWLIGGLVLLWATNVARIMVIFWAGSAFGEHFSLGILHPVLGMILFGLGILAMVCLVRPLGMRIEMPASKPKKAYLGQPGVYPERMQGASGPPAVPKIFVAITVVLAAALVLGVAQNNLKAYDLVAGASGEAKLLSFSLVPQAPGGWSVRRIAIFDWAKPLFGDDSTWQRFTLQPPATGPRQPVVVADVVNTGDPSTFSAYGIEACYQFHGDSLRDVTQVQLLGGIHGQSLSFAVGSGGSWSIVYWISPVKGSSGQNRYERTVLYVTDGGRGASAFAQIRAQLARDKNRAAADPQQEQLAANRSFLVSVADQVIRAQARERGPHAGSVTAARVVGSR